jgi:hypothetical protein
MTHRVTGGSVEVLTRTSRSVIAITSATVNTALSIDIVVEISHLHVHARELKVAAAVGQGTVCMAPLIPGSSGLV